MRFFLTFALLCWSGCDLAASMGHRAPHASPSHAAPTATRDDAVAGPTITPAASTAAPVASGHKPAWCATLRQGEADVAYHAIKRPLDDDGELPTWGWWSEEAIRSLGLTACFESSNADTAATVASIYTSRRSELKALASLDDAELDKLLAGYIDKMKFEPQSQAFCGSSDDDGELPTMRDRALARSRRVLGCVRGQQTAGQYDWPDASEVQKVAQDGECMAWLAKQAASKQWDGLRFVRCNASAAHLDAGKFTAEIATWPGIPRTWAKIRHAYVVRYTALAQRLYRKHAKDAEDVAFLFDAPEKGYQAFMTAYRANAPLYDRLHTMLLERGHDKPLAAFKGCEADYWRPLARAFATKKPSTVEAATDLVREPTNAMLAWGAYLCAELDGDSALLNTFVPPRLVALSPKRAAFWAAVNGANASSDKDRHIGVSELSLGAGEDSDDGVKLTRRLAHPSAEGVVAKAVPGGAGVHVTFDGQVWYSPIMNCVETGKIDSIGSDGKIIYRRNCTAAGQEKVTSYPDPIDVPARFAAIARPGRRLRFDKELGGVLEAYASKDPKAPLVGYYGLAW